MLQALWKGRRGKALVTYVERAQLSRLLRKVGVCGGQTRHCIRVSHLEVMRLVRRLLLQIHQLLSHTVAAQSIVLC